MYNIRFIALTDNIDTLNSDSASMDMLPIMNVFNEWYAQSDTFTTASNGVNTPFFIR